LYGQRLAQPEYTIFSAVHSQPEANGQARDSIKLSQAAPPLEGYVMTLRVLDDSDTRQEFGQADHSDQTLSSQGTMQGSGKHFAYSNSGQDKFK
jgi:hypothetical protein